MEDWQISKNEKSGVFSRRAFWRQTIESCLNNNLQTSSLLDERKEYFNYICDVDDVIKEEKLTIFTKISTNDLSLKKALYHVHSGNDFYTNRIISDYKSFHVDHIIPRSKGGLDCIANYVPVINMTNRRKHDRYFRDISERLVLSNIVLYAHEVLYFYIINKHNLEHKFLSEQLVEKEFEIKETFSKEYLDISLTDEHLSHEKREENRISAEEVLENHLLSRDNIDYGL